MGMDGGGGGDGDGDGGGAGDPRYFFLGKIYGKML